MRRRHARRALALLAIAALGAAGCGSGPAPEKGKRTTLPDPCALLTSQTVERVVGPSLGAPGLLDSATSKVLPMASCTWEFATDDALTFSSRTTSKRRAAVEVSLYEDPDRACESMRLFTRDGRGVRLDDLGREAVVFQSDPFDPTTTSVNFCQDRARITVGLHAWESRPDSPKPQPLGKAEAQRTVVTMGREVSRRLMAAPAARASERGPRAERPVTIPDACGQLPSAVARRLTGTIDSQDGPTNESRPRSYSESRCEWKMRELAGIPAPRPDRKAVIRDLAVTIRVYAPQAGHDGAARARVGARQWAMGYAAKPFSAGTGEHASLVLEPYPKKARTARIGFALDDARVVVSYTGVDLTDKGTTPALDTELEQAVRDAATAIARSLSA
ncbi:hypothetical protein [Actinopolymorpha alba]|uniref:hypothetical protein n=1 Tax=Actinopolymorpha alba TaxID=533267 RepID=UPI00039C3A64|nr:hypothetical protein [Actinopolymorpha alba]